MNTIEGNKLIAEFMEAIEYADFPHLYWFETPPTIYYGHQWELPHMQYRASFDWIVPVAERIVKVSCELPTIKKRAEARDYCDKILDQLCNFQKDGVWIYSVKFIQWYNENKDL